MDSPPAILDPEPTRTRTYIPQNPPIEHRRVRLEVRRPRSTNHSYSSSLNTSACQLSHSSIVTPPPSGKHAVVKFAPVEVLAAVAHRSCRVMRDTN